MNLKNKNILIVGFGISGQAAARFLAGRGAHVAVTDSSPAPETALPPDLRNLEYHFGGHSPEIFEGRDLIVVSPGVPLDLPGLQKARSLRIPVIGEFGLAVHLLGPKAKFIAVTGTNGKSTTVTLIHEILLAAGVKAALAGNIGTPLLEICMAPRMPEWIVVEVSSYQLETVGEFHPRVAVLLNITEDHLDRYASFEDYARAKYALFSRQNAKDAIIYKEDDPTVKKGIRRAKAKKIGFSIKTRLVKTAIVFGREKYPLNRVKLIGSHNIENMMASIAAARFIGVPQKKVQSALEGFKGLPHRTEFVRTRLGVSYFDDSKGTNVDAVVKSLAGFPDGSVVLIAGGRDKGGSYEPLRRIAVKKVKSVIAIGEARRRIAQALADATEVETVESLHQAVPLSARKAKPGDVVLLSPACSSFDQFKDYKERGEMFQRLVKNL